MNKIAILFSGTGSNMSHILDTMHNKSIEVTMTLTNNPNANGIKYPAGHNIPVEIVDSKEFKDREEFDRKIVGIINEYDVDLVVLAGFMRILTPEFTDNIKAINLHPSLLPRHKGLHAIEKSFKDEHKLGGVSTHYVTSELDAGEIILQKEIFKDELDFDSYCQEVKKAEKEILSQSIMIALERRDNG